MVRAGDHAGKIAHDPAFRIRLIESVQKLRQCGVGRRVVSMHGDVGGPNRAGLDQRAFLGPPVRFVQALIELTMRLDGEGASQRILAGIDMFW